jgi:glycosyltransferase involved in cell wall biosynthesis
MPATPLDAPSAAVPDGRPRRVAILVPAYNVAPWPAALRDRLREGFGTLAQEFDASVWLVFVDDGSMSTGTTETAHAPGLAELGVPVVRARHCLNRGQGAALQTALSLARSPAIDADVFVTMDADGQHDPADLPALVEPVVNGGFNIAFGNRFAAATSEDTGLPTARRAILRAAAMFEHAISGIDLGDAHNGFRAFDRTTARAIQLRQDRMAHATEFKQIVARRGLRYAEVPVRITYTDETLRQGQRNLEVVNILRELTRGWWLH